MRTLTPSPNCAESAAARLRKDILHAVDTLGLKGGDRVHSERQWARRLGVSYMTARKALGQLVSEGLLERRPRQGVFIGSAAALRAGAKLRRVRGLFYLELLSGFYRRMAAALARRLSEEGVDLVWSTVTELAGADLTARVAAWDDDAYLLVGLLPAPLLEALVRKGKPLTVVDFSYPGLAADHVVLDNEGVGFAAAERFFAAGRRRVAYLGGAIDKIHPYYDAARRAEWPNSVLRGMGVRRAYHERMLAPDEDLFRLAPAPHEARTAHAEWLGRPDRPTAVLCFHAQAGVELLRAARARGLDVPRELAVAVTGEPPEPYPEDLPALTHFQVDWTTMGQAAAVLLLERRRLPALPPRRVVVPWTCVPGASAGW